MVTMRPASTLPTDPPRPASPGRHPSRPHLHREGKWHTQGHTAGNLRGTGLHPDLGGQGAHRRALGAAADCSPTGGASPHPGCPSASARVPSNSAGSPAGGPVTQATFLWAGHGRRGHSSPAARPGPGAHLLLGIGLSACPEMPRSAPRTSLGGALSLSPHPDGETPAPEV